MLIFWCCACNSVRLGMMSQSFGHNMTSYGHKYGVNWTWTFFYIWERATSAPLEISRTYQEVVWDSCHVCPLCKPFIFQYREEDLVKYIQTEMISVPESCACGFPVTAIRKGLSDITLLVFSSQPIWYSSISQGEEGTFLTRTGAKSGF